MDSVPFYKRQDILNAVENAGHKLEFLPTYYSPDLNPIEHYWAKAKSRRRKLQCEVDRLLSENFL